MKFRNGIGSNVHIFALRWGEGDHMKRRGGYLLLVMTMKPLDPLRKGWKAAIAKYIYMQSRIKKWNITWRNRRVL